MNKITETIQMLVERIRAIDLSRHLPGSLDKENSRLVFHSVVIGVVVWGPVYLLRLAVESAFHAVLGWVENGPGVLFIFLPLWLGAMIVYFLVKFRGTRIIYRDNTGIVHSLADVEGDGLERAIALYYASEPSFESTILGQEGVEARWEMPTYMLALRKMAATLATLGSGGSGGLEGSVALIGESLAAMMFKPRQPIQAVGKRHRWLQRPIRWWSMTDVDQLQTAQLSGIAAAVATLTGAPFMSAFFAAEVMYRRRPLVEKLIYSLISTLVAYFLSTLVQAGHVSLFSADPLYLPPADWRYYGLVILTSVVIAFVSINFVWLRKQVDNAFHHRVSNMWVRHLLGASLTGVIAIIVVVLLAQYDSSDPAAGLALVLGTGTGAIDAALAGQLTLTIGIIALFGKILTTVLTIGSGGSGGLLIPSLYLGTMSATVIAAITDYEPMLLIVPAMTASLASIANVPIAAILLSMELFSSHYLPPALLALIVSALLTQDTKIYRTQRETFDKRQILPGVEVRRVTVPATWMGKSIIELDLRRRFEVTVLGILDMSGAEGLPQVQLDISPGFKVEAGDTIVVMGDEENLNTLEMFIRDSMDKFTDPDDASSADSGVTS